MTSIRSRWEVWPGCTLKTLRNLLNSERTKNNYTIVYWYTLRTQDNFHCLSIWLFLHTTSLYMGVWMWLCTALLSSLYCDTIIHLAGILQDSTLNFNSDEIVAFLCYISTESLFSLWTCLNKNSSKTTAISTWAEMVDNGKYVRPKDQGLIAVY